MGWVETEQHLRHSIEASLIQKSAHWRKPDKIRTPAFVIISAVESGGRMLLPGYRNLLKSDMLISRPFDSYQYTVRSKIVSL